MKIIFTFILFFLITFLSYSQRRELLSNVYFKTPDIGWIVDDHYNSTYVYKTTNGGSSWTLINDLYYFRSGQFLNDSIGILTFGYKTIDGGITWKHHFKKEISPFYFIDENIGYGIPYETNNDTIYKTLDEGVTWIFAGEIPSAWKLWVINSETVIIISRNNKIYKTTNSGLTWIQPESAFPENSIFYLVDIAFADRMTGFITGFEDANYPTTKNRVGVIKTIDGGSTWSLDTLGIYGFLKFSDSITGFMHVGNKFLKTTDKGNSWFKPGSVDSAWTFFFLDNLNGFVIGYNYFFAKTTDGGYTWTQLPFNTSAITSQEENNLPLQYSLTQNYPNPFNPSTKIKFTIPKQGLVTLKIYDVLGKELLQLVNEEKPSGKYEIEFDGSSLSSGIYFYQIQAGEFLNTKKMVLMK